MAAAFTRNDTILWRSHRNSIGEPNNLQNQLPNKLQLSKSCSRFPQSVFPRAKKLEISASSIIFSSRKSYSSKFALFGWYLTMVKSRPIFTKSVTSALIYTAADLSSQVWASKVHL
ncbi:Peroxisomal membrane 22 kDa (Mpv17/PMP22) family protein [Abeliophyllum distichum]|uniref:Peroxisomal membrane 22 kDa (Mpv17/PMP22) family protein n=1 Tax=Abeliophyllum distichum TaxID=126358 RepID=A0ABD1TH88_9LAMI